MPHVNKFKQLNIKCYSPAALPVAFHPTAGNVSTPTQALHGKMLQTNLPELFTHDRDENIRFFI